MHFFDVAALHVKHTTSAREHFGADDADDSQRLTYFQFHLMSRASHPISTGSEFHTAARLLGSDPPCGPCAHALSLALEQSEDDARGGEPREPGAWTAAPRDDATPSGACRALFSTGAPLLASVAALLLLGVLFMNR